ncbi:CoA transferase [Glutamicibacter uratoxydans]|uniref:CoA transferase n=1 Tax=Glutamicibacter uratoxydans TaxID=43667 RepID=A0A4Y4DPS9_GLUUR|nr:CoA transferase [Glutamicibacter uratoxydans]GED05550.1 CoA transferase [Glutamicibacter uratoxydans]
MSGLRPLDGIIVADFSRVLAGPLSTMTLADLGATVIKVERPGSGDDTRSWGPPFSATGATYFESVNRNKQSIALDLREDEDRAVARELAVAADVLVENFLTGGMDKLGLGYEELSVLNPSLIYVSVTGYGSKGGATIPGYDFIVQALGGLMSITGDAGSDPMKAGVALVDVLTAKDAAISILAALQNRQRTGRGAHIEVNLLSSLQGALANQGQAYLGAGKIAGRMGNAHPSIVPYQLLNCRGGSVAVACGNDGQFAKLCAELSMPQLAGDPRFATNTARVAHREQLIPLLEAALAGDDADSWQRRLSAAGVPAGKVANIAEGIEYSASLGLEPTITVVDGAGQEVGEQIRHPATWTPALDSPRQAPPGLGEHNQAVRQWLASRAGAAAAGRS